MGRLHVVTAQRRPVASILTLLIALVVTSCSSSAKQRPTSAPSPPRALSTVRLANPPGPICRVEVIGRSVLGRPLTAYSCGRAQSTRRVLVVGVVHGNEADGLPIAQALVRAPSVAGALLVVIPDLNPDGRALGTRQNARHVDLNRNFPYHWQRTGQPGDQQWTGPSVLSEPESRALVGVVRRVRPTVTVWFHQPVGVVDDSGGSADVERRFARVLGEPFQRLPRYDGSAVSWQDTAYRGTTAFVVELPRRVTAELRRRALLAVRDLER